MLTVLRAHRHYYKFLLLTAAIIWGSSFVVVKNTLYTLPPAFIMTVRFLIAFIILFCVFFKQIKLINKKVFLYGTILGCFMCLSFFFQNYGLIYTTPSKNAFLTASYCIMTPFLFWLIGKSKPDKYNILAGILCIVGIAFISLTNSFILEKGDIYSLLAGFFVAVQLVLITIYGKKQNLLLITIVQFGIGALASLIICLLFEKMPNLSTISNANLLQLFYLTIFCTLITMLLQNIGLKFVEPAQASIILSLEGVFAIIFSILFFNEQPTIKMYIGFLAIMIAVIVSEAKPKFLSLKNFIKHR